MNQYSLPHLPISEKYRLLIDDQNKNGLVSFTLDAEKVKYNRQLLGNDFNLEGQRQADLSTEGITTVFALGRYITILRIKKDETEQQMWFIDFEADLNFDVINNTKLENYFSDEFVSAFNKHKELLLESFTSENDMVELVLS